MAAIYPWEYIKDAGMATVRVLLRDAKQRQEEGRRWQEWLAFAPPLSLMGVRPPTYKEFCGPITVEREKEIPDTVFDDIRKMFNLTGG